EKKRSDRNSDNSDIRKSELDVIGDKKEKEKEEEEKNTRATPGASAPLLPDWLPLDSWEGFLENRKRLGVPNTPRALGQVLHKLTKAKGEGQNPATLLDEATEKGWRSIYPEKAHGTGNRAEKLQQSNVAALNTAFPMDR